MPHDTPPKLFELQPRRWYAMQLYGHEFAPCGSASFSPILVEEVRPLGAGNGTLELSWHENYPSGVHAKTYRVQVLARDAFLFARRVDGSHARFLMIEELTWRWLDMHFGIRRKAETDVQSWKEQGSRSR